MNTSKIFCKSIAIDLSNSTTQFLGQSRKLDGNYNTTNAGNNQSTFILNILGKMKKREQIFLKEMKQYYK